MKKMDYLEGIKLEVKSIGLENFRVKEYKRKFQHQYFDFTFYSPVQPN